MTARTACPATSENEWKPLPGSGLREVVIAAAGAMAISIPALLGGYLAVRAGASDSESPVARLLEEPPSQVVAVAAADHGRQVFVSTCAACHGAQGTGVAGLGKDLVQSDFVAILNDEALERFVRVGRAADDPRNTTKVPMPPMGGNANLTPEDLRDVILYVRALQDPRRMPDLPAMVAAVPTAPAAPTAEDVAAAGGDAELAEFIASGAKLYVQSCAACHGTDAKGGLGKDLVRSEFCSKLSDDDLLAFVKKGRDPGDPMNTTGIGMPAKGGNPALTEDDLLDIIAYLRSLHEKHKSTASK